MKIWIDAQLSPSLALWINKEFPDVRAVSLTILGLRGAEDEEVFNKAREEQAVVMTKDGDFVNLLMRHGPPPQVLWVTCGNTSNAAMRALLSLTLTDALRLLAEGEWLVEISGQ